MTSPASNTMIFPKNIDLKNTLGTIVTAGLLILIAFLLRIYNIDGFISYHQDQVRDLLYIKQHIASHTVPLLGPKASVGAFFLPPFWYYLMYATYLISPSPVAPASMTAIFSALTAGFIYVFGARFFNKKIGILAGLLYATSHLSIEYSRFSWNPNPIPFFVIGTLYFLYAYYQEHKVRDLILATLFANLGIQLHFEGAPLFLFILITIFFLYRQHKQKLIIFYELLVVALLNILLLSPFLYYELTHQFENITGILTFSSTQPAMKFFGIPFLIKYFLFQFPIVVSRIILFNNYPTGVLLTTLIAAVVFFTVRRDIITHRVKQVSLLSWFFFSSLLMLFVYKNSLIDYYLLFLIPIIILILVTSLYSYNKKIGTLLLIMCIGISFITSPVFGKSDQTYKTINARVVDIAQQKKYCLTYYIFKETYIEQKFRYLFSLQRNKPRELMSCIPMYYLCEGALCRHNLIITGTLQGAELVSDFNESGVQIYKKD